MSSVCISCHKATKVDNGSFLLECIQCNTFWHHRCHRPPVSDKDLAQVLTRFTQDRKRGVRNAKVQWTCISCVNSKGKLPESQKGKGKEKEVIVLDDDDDIELIEPSVPARVPGDGDRLLPPTTREQQSSATRGMPKPPAQRQAATKSARPQAAAAGAASIQNQLDSEHLKKAKAPISLPPPPTDSSTRNLIARSTTRNIPASNAPDVISHNERTGISIINDPLVFLPPALNLVSNSSSTSTSTATHKQKQHDHASSSHIFPSRETSRSRSLVAGLDELSMSTPGVDSGRTSPETATDALAASSLKVKQERLEAMKIDQVEPSRKSAQPGSVGAPAIFVPVQGEEPLLLQDWVEARHRVRAANEGPDMYDRVKQRQSTTSTIKRPRKTQARSLATIQASPAPAFATARKKAPLFELSVRLWKNEKIQTIDSLKF